MLTVAADRLAAEAARLGKTVNIRLYGQEVNPETYAIAKADLLLKGDGRDADNIKFGSTISEDGHEGSTFDFMLSNPPYGKSWKKDIAKMTGESEKKEKDDISDPRFTKFGYGKDNKDASFDMLPRSSDGQLLFLLNNVSKMKTKTVLGSRIAEVHNGSSLFTGDAGQGESNARRYLVEKDLVEAIIALPENMFYNTGIGTFIWVLSNRKEEHRKGKIQLIDATAMKTPLRRNMGKKNCELSPKARRDIVRLFMDFEETEQSKIFPNEEFGYWLVDILRPLRLKVTLTDETLAAFRKANPKDAAIADVLDKVRTALGDEILDYNVFWKAVKKEAVAQGLKLAQGKQAAIRAACTEKDENAEPVVKKQAKGKAPEYESDNDLKDTERVPLLYEGGIERFFATEVKPYAEDAWVDEKNAKIGYEIRFTRYFKTISEDADVPNIITNIQHIQSIINQQMKFLEPHAYSSYKDTGEYWIPSIPSHWKAVKIKFLFDERSEKGHPDESLLAATQNMGVVPKEIYGQRTVEATKDLELLKLVKKDDFVISLRSFQGGIERAYYQGIISPAYTIMIPKGIEVEYFKHLAKSKVFINLLQSCVTGIREGQNIDYGILKNVRIPVPPIDEQIKIAKYLDSINARINARINEISLLRQYKDAIMSGIVTGETDIREEEILDYSLGDNAASDYLADNDK